MLDNSFDEDLTPGSNLPESSSNSLWIHLLPDLEPRHAAWISVGERPRTTPLAGAQRTTVLEFDDGPTHGSRRSISSLSTRAVSRLAELDKLDLVLLPAAIATGIAREPHLLEAFARALPPEATVAIDAGTDVPHRRHHRAIERISAALGGGGLCELSTRRGEVAAPSGGLLIPVVRPVRLRRIRGRARRAAGLIVRRASHLLGRSAGTAARTHPSDIRLHRPIPVTRRSSRRSGVILLRRAGHDATAVPPYLVDVAARAGVDLSHADWAVAPPRGYRSQKVIFALTRGRDDVDLIVKMTQESRFNARLDNERRALEHLTAVPAAHERAVPRVVFSGTRGGLLIVAETALAGRPFRTVSTAEPGCPVAAATVAWLTDLAAETAHRGATRGPVLAPVEALLERFLATFPTSPMARRTLAAVMEPLRSNPDAVPGVVSHGDPGTWNLVVDPDGRVGFLDWENFESTGMPTWDLILFLRTFASFTAETAGRRPTADVVVDSLCQPGPLNTYVQRAFRTYTDRLGLDGELVPSLVLTCWIHQSLKEATRLAPNDRGGRSRRIVARVLAEPDLLTGLAGTRP